MTSETGRALSLLTIVPISSRQKPSGEDDLLEHFDLSRLHQLATTLQPQNYLSNVSGDIQLYSGARWQLAGLADWPPSSYTFPEPNPEQVRALCRLRESGEYQLPEVDKGVLITDSSAVSIAKKDRKKAKKKDRERNGEKAAGGKKRERDGEEAQQGRALKFKLPRTDSGATPQLAAPGITPPVKPGGVKLKLRLPIK